MTSVRTCVQNTLRQMGDECLTIASNCLVVAAVVNNVEHIDVLADRIHTTLDERFRFGAQFEISGFLLEDVEVTTSRLLEMAPDELPAELALVN